MPLRLLRKVCDTAYHSPSPVLSVSSAISSVRNGSRPIRMVGDTTETLQV